MKQVVAAPNPFRCRALERTSFVEGFLEHPRFVTRRLARSEGEWSMDVLIFDMDGVLVDVSGSYRKTIQKTVSLYLAFCFGFSEGKETKVTEEEISLFKAAGGFNNDWDLTSGLLLYLISISGLPKRQTLKRFSSIDETLSFLEKETKAHRLSRKKLMERKDIPAFTNKVRSAGGGLSGIRKVLGSSWDGWLYGSGDLKGENLVKRIFQEVYLGRRFRGCYGLERRFYRGKGFYLYEKLLIPRRMLEIGRAHV